MSIATDSHSVSAERTYHALFRVGVIVKTIDGALEIIAGCILVLISPDALRALISFFLPESASGVWHSIFGDLYLFTPESQSFWALIFLSHGIIKMFLVAGLLREYRRMYPIAAGAFAIFALYQIHHMTLAPSTLLGLITTLDIMLVVLILHEYRARRIRR